jgi:hypothetical protein
VSKNSGAPARPGARAGSIDFTLTMPSPKFCLAKGRVVTPATINDMPNLWSRDYK